VNFGEAFIAWIHIKALRVFVESVLRFVDVLTFIYIINFYCLCFLLFFYTFHRSTATRTVRL